MKPRIHSPYEVEKPYVKAPGGIIVPQHVFEDHYMQKRPVAIDFFAGAGGMSCGLKQGGFHVIAAVELDFWAVQTYMVNLGAYPCQLHFDTDERHEAFEKHLSNQIKENDEGVIERAPIAGTGWISGQDGIPGTNHMFIADVRNLTGKKILETIGMELGEVDLVAGGPPCQGFSYSGQRDPNDDRNKLLFEYARLITEIQPKTMVMENVPGIVDMTMPDGQNVIDAFKDILHKGSYAPRKALDEMINAQFGKDLFLHQQETASEAKNRAEKEKKARTADGQMDMFA